MNKLYLNKRVQINLAEGIDFSTGFRQFWGREIPSFRIL